MPDNKQWFPLTFTLVSQAVKWQVHKELLLQLYMDTLMEGAFQGGIIYYSPPYFHICHNITLLVNWSL